MWDWDPRVVHWRAFDVCDSKGNRTRAGLSVHHRNLGGSGVCWACTGTKTLEKTKNAIANCMNLYDDDAIALDFAQGFCKAGSRRAGTPVLHREIALGTFRVLGNIEGDQFSPEPASSYRSVSDPEGHPDCAQNFRRPTQVEPKQQAHQKACYWNK